MCFLQLFSQEKEHPLYCVAFYNLENLFDTISGPNDKEYTQQDQKNGIPKILFQIKKCRTVFQR